MPTNKFDGFDSNCGSNPNTFLTDFRIPSLIRWINIPNKLTYNVDAYVCIAKFAVGPSDIMTRLSP